MAHQIATRKSKYPNREEQSPFFLLPVWTGGGPYFINKMFDVSLPVLSRVPALSVFAINSEPLANSLSTIGAKGFSKQFTQISAFFLCNLINLPGKALRKTDRENPR